MFSRCEGDSALNQGMLTFLIHRIRWHVRTLAEFESKCKKNPRILSAVRFHAIRSAFRSGDESVRRLAIVRQGPFRLLVASL